MEAFNPSERPPISPKGKTDRPFDLINYLVAETSTTAKPQRKDINGPTHVVSYFPIRAIQIFKDLDLTGQAQPL